MNQQIILIYPIPKDIPLLEYHYFFKVGYSDVHNTQQKHAFSNQNIENDKEQFFIKR